ncbi:unnamed protein product [Sphenostylis stenocarpa]|uniref:Uncharacterized protein n=1 Tax=Sphenostylis stenocarpa TaxID=92480 RepID=A0AA86VMB4_9FABA|nr:unnamed protein product [Sphenostylis stenocarpa]
MQVGSRKKQDFYCMEPSFFKEGCKFGLLRREGTEDIRFQSRDAIYLYYISRVLSEVLNHLISLWTLSKAIRVNDIYGTLLFLLPLVYIA